VEVEVQVIQVDFKVNNNVLVEQYKEE